MEFSSRFFMVNKNIFLIFIYNIKKNEILNFKIYSNKKNKMLLLAFLLLSLPENYHPEFCSVERYIFSLVKIGDEYKIHGLWPDKCQQCETCGYPTCCNMNKFQNASTPKDTQFLEEHWLSSSTSHPIQTCGRTVNTLIEHEVIKHASCMNLYVNEYIALVKKLFTMYYDYAIQTCDKECNIFLNDKFDIIT